MKRISLSGALALTVFDSNTLAAAAFNMHGLVGRRWLQVEGDGVQTTEFQMGVYKRLPGFPLGAGLHAGIQNHRNEDTPHADTAYGYEVGVEAMAWVPEYVLDKRDMRPYIKYRFPVYSYHVVQGSVGGKRFDENFSSDISNFTIGLRFAYDRDWRVLAELVYGSGEWRLKPLKGQEPPQKGIYGVKSRGLLIGTELVL